MAVAECSRFRCEYQPEAALPLVEHVKNAPGKSAETARLDPLDAIARSAAWVAEVRNGEPQYAQTCCVRPCPPILAMRSRACSSRSRSAGLPAPRVLDQGPLNLAPSTASCDSPESAKLQFGDHAQHSVLVHWDDVPAAQLAQPGRFELRSEAVADRSRCWPRSR